MQISMHSGELPSATADLLVLGVRQASWKKAPAVQTLDRALGGALVAAAKDEQFDGKAKQRLVLPTFGKVRAKRVALVGLGKDEPSAPVLLQLGGTASRLARGVGAAAVVLALPLDAKASLPWQLAAVARGLELGAYRFDRYLSEPAPGTPPKKVTLAFADGGKLSTAAQKAIARAQAISRGVAVARDFVNEPASELYPETFAARARKLATAAHLKVRVIAPAELEKMGMRLLLGVGRGSERAPRLLHLSYVPAGAKASGGIALVGKGITFDSGGLNIKPTGGIETMKTDMAGAAAVLGTMLAVAALKPKTVVHGVMALAENMPSGSAIRPSDVIKSAHGKTVEINNTDAEGRLVLADALHYATTLAPRHIVDLATLTGASKIALGPTTAGLFSNDDALASALLASAESAGESIWRMPLTDGLRDQLKSDIADIKNTGERWGGAITAALFLREFVGEHAWAHLDIAGPADSQQDEGIYAKGGTGFAVATLADWITG